MPKAKEERGRGTWVPFKGREKVKSKQE